MSLLSLIRPEVSHYQSIVLPARFMRTGGRYFQRDEDFLGSGKLEAARLQKHCNLTHNSTILDIGCGPCRLPIGILAKIGEVAGYCGIDVNKKFTAWGKRHITPHHPKFKFLHIDVQNERYNKQGVDQQKNTTLPFEENSFNIIYTYSVFSHLHQEDVEAYLQECHRLLRPDGRIFCTAFVEEGIPEATENPEGYQGREWKGALNCMLYNKEFFDKLIEKYNFRIEKFVYGEETDGQSAYYLSKR